MNDESKKNYAGELFLAQRLLSATAGKTSAVLDSYSGWLLAGFGGALAFLVGNVDKLAKYLAVDSLRQAVYLFLGAVGAGLVEKYLASIVAAGVATSEIGGQLGAEDSALDLDFTVILQEVEKATFYPARWVVRRQFRNVMKGDLAAGGRLFSKIAQLQGLFLLAQIVFSVWSIAVIGGGLNGQPTGPSPAGQEALLPGRDETDLRPWPVTRPTNVSRSTFELRLAVEGPQPGGLTLTAPDGATLYLAADPVVTQSDIERTEVGPSDHPPHYQAYIHFTPTAAARLRTFTREHIGARLAIVVDGKILLAPVIVAEFGPTAVIQGLFSRAEVTRLAERLAP